MLCLQPFTWDVVDEAGEEGGIQIQCWAFDRDSKIHLLRIEDYPATCFVELPTQIEGRDVEWFDRDVDEFIKSLNQKLTSPPESYIFSKRPKLYYYQKEKYPMIHLTFTTLKAMSDCSRLLSRPFYFKGKGRGKIAVWENKIPHLRKFLTRVRLEPAQWFRVDAKKVVDKISVLENEYIASWKDINPLPNTETADWMVYPKILVFDIEAYSKNKKAFPDKYNTSDVCFMISVITQRLGKRETRERKVILLGDCHDIENAQVIRVNSELECIDTFAQLIIKEDPDIISGYNHHGFDNDYLNSRLERLMEEWREMGRLIGDKVTIESRTWSSAAYGHNEVNILKMSGRISIDMLPVIKRDYKLPRYDLSTVGMFFLGRGKHPVKPEEIFVAYENYQLVKNNPGDQERYKAAVDDLTRVTRYCIEDAEITLDLAEKVHIWIASVELANIVGVSIMDLYTRGQQVRCLSKIYDEAHRQGYVIDFHEALNVVFNGGAVEKPEPGVEDEVPSFDVNSMYPSIIIHNNIDYTTFVPDHLHETVKDEDCHVIEFDQMERPKKIVDKTSDEDFEVDIDIGEATLVHRKIRFVKKSLREGIVPKIVNFLISERKKVKNAMKPLEKAKAEGKPYDEILLIILDRRQLALKCTANSFFGFMGAYIGKLPLIEGGMAITAKGRDIAAEFKRYLRETYQAKIVYGDTDSVMPKFFHLDGMSWEEKWAFWERVNTELSKIFPGIVLEMEKVMRIICFAPKMYAYLTYSKDGKLTNDPKKMQAKGIVLARRDGTPWVRQHYRDILFNILWNYSPDLRKQAESMEKSFNMIIDTAIELQQGRVDWQDLAKINEMGANYKNPNYPMAILSNHLRQIGRPAQAGDRLRYVICDIPGEKSIGRKMRTDDEFIESQETSNPLKLDVNYYLENALLKKIDPLFQVGYNKILPLLDGVGYKPNSKKHFVAITDPVKMIVRAIEDGLDIDKLKPWFKEHLTISLEKPTIRKKVIIRHRNKDKTEEVKKTIIPNVVQLD